MLALCIGASIIPYGVMDYADLIAAPKPATISVFEYMAPGWGGAFISWAIIISVCGSWLSFTMLPAGTSSMMSEHHLLPASWNKMNAKGAPQMALLIVGVLMTGRGGCALASAPRPRPQRRWVVPVWVYRFMS